ncbi:RAVE (regulator of V-ATPase assembly) complex subunit RAV1/DMX protein, WD repeat superfamily [Ceraceosorus bombacis]|uniref:RAVE (Regulator of V-ATPase assembly) complex subunit RAV1/DMX protein, WD repeat superfamily n=1 Tax=Ceraceosorus bombacis TaxID=401625 RepID=A0A0P1BAY2_9BASI|nr:RAVE (regulator of V-ATPase assembly) complex subunit RAV1/DMX protein, WD repeat superfamily [Ceraceosorus bombacis]
MPVPAIPKTSLATTVPSSAVLTHSSSSWGHINSTFTYLPPRQSARQLAADGAGNATSSAFSGASLRDQITVQAVGTEIIIRNGRFEVEQCIAFPQPLAHTASSSTRTVEQSIQAVCAGDVEGALVITACCGRRIAAWRRSSSGIWKLHSQLDVDERDGRVTSLDLRSGDILVGCESSVSIWRYIPLSSPSPWQRVWRKRCPSSIVAASWSPLGTKLAAYAQDDDRVLIWAHRAGTAAKPKLVDTVHHSRPVKSMTWRAPSESTDQSEALVTTTSDGCIRFWVPVIDEPNKHRLWSSISPSLFSHHPPHYLQSANVGIALDRVLALHAKENQLLEVGLKESNPKVEEWAAGNVKRLDSVRECPDLILAFKDGSLVVQALGNVDRAPPTLYTLYTVLSVGLDLEIPNTALDVHLIPTMSTSSGSVTDPTAVLLVGSSVYDISPATFFEGLPGGFTSRAPDNASADHQEIIQQLVASADGKALLSRTRSGCTRWTACSRGGQSGLKGRHARTGCIALSKRFELSHNDRTSKATLVDLSTNEVTHYDLPAELRVASAAIHKEKPVALLLSEQGQICLLTWQSVQAQYLAAPTSSSSSTAHFFPVSFSADEICVGAIDKHGRMQGWKLSLTDKGPWKRNFEIATGLASHDLVRASNDGRLIAIVTSEGSEKSQLSIWNVDSAPFSSGLEYLSDWESQIVALDWSDSTHGATKILALATASKITLLAPSHVHPLHHASTPWDVLASVDCSRFFALPIHSICFLGHQIVVASGANLHVFGPQLDVAASKTQHRDAESDVKREHVAIEAANKSGPLATLHPDFLLQALLLGKMELAENIIVDLVKDLRSDRIPRLRLLQDDYEKLYTGCVGAQKQSGRRAQAPLFDSEFNGADTFSPVMAEELVKMLEARDAVVLTSGQQQSLIHIVQTLGELAGHKQALDLMGKIYLAALLHRHRSLSSVAESTLAPDEVLFAYHSASQEVLQSRITALHKDQFTWQAAQSSGVFLWLRDRVALNAIAEQVARAQFNSGTERDPVKCSLFYFALGKRKLVQGLWRQAAWHPEQRKMLAFLNNDFELERWRTAACKNAFALLSQRRFEFAASFFMLGDSLQDAVNVCVRNLGDLHLALALAKIREGSDQGLVFTQLLRKHVLPLAFNEGSKALASWALWVLKSRELAMRALVRPLQSIVDEAGLPSGSNVARMTAESPALGLLFAELRVSSSAEQLGDPMGYVRHLRYLLERRGCHALGLALLREWKFAAQKPLPTASIEPGPVQDVGEGLLAALQLADTPVKRGLETVTPAVKASAISPTASGLQQERRATSLFDVQPPVAQISSSAMRASSSFAAAKDASLTRDAALTPETPPETKAKVKEKEKVASLMKASSAASQQQGAQDFSFDSFGF